MAGTILDPVKVATNVNITDIATKNWALGTDTIDGIVDLAVGDRVLVKAQTFLNQNGIYVFTIVPVSGVNRIRLVRASDFAAAAQIQPNTCVFITLGDLHADTGWLIANNSPVTVGSDEIEFKRFTINLALGGIDLPSSIVLRKENGRPLTNDQLDGNFKYLYDSLVSKLDISAFTPIAVRDKINTLTAQIANLDAWKLRGNAPTVDGNANTIVLRDGNGAVTSPTFIGSLAGNAETADLADFATLAANVTGIVAVANGGTGANNPTAARNNLIAVSREGDNITGKFNLRAGIQSVPIAPLNLSIGNPIIVSDGDVWAGTVTTNGQISDYRLFYKFTNTDTRSIAHIESPNFEGAPTAPTAPKITNNTTIASTAFVQLHVSDINTALNLKASLASPALTGTPTTPTAATTVENTQIASTGYVKNKIDNILTSYDTSLAVNNKIQALSNTLTPTIATAQQTADEALERSGLPPGVVAYFAANNVPLGWLKANGGLVLKAQYESLFNVIGYSYGGGGDFFALPDLRGEFIRSLDDGRGIDPFRTLGSAQTAQIKKHKHVGPYSETYSSPFGSTDNRGYQGSGRTDSDNFLYHTNDGSDFDGVVNPAGVIGDETRPRNVAMLACIKAFGVPDSVDAISLSNAINEVNQRVRKAGDTMTGALTLSGAPTLALHAATKQYVDSTVAAIQLLKGDKGDQGDQGDKGDEGPPGPAGSTISNVYTLCAGVGDAAVKQMNVILSPGTWQLVCEATFGIGDPGNYDFANTADAYIPFNSVIPSMPYVRAIAEVRLYRYGGRGFGRLVYGNSMGVAQLIIANQLSVPLTLGEPVINGGGVYARKATLTKIS